MGEKLQIPFDYAQGRLSTALRSGRDDKGIACVFMESRYWDGEQQVPPLRFALVGMTILL
jgi:hypothetical protein